MNLRQDITKLSEHFTYAEAIKTSHPITNFPTDEELQVLYIVAEKMEIVRKILGNNPITITSWFRSQRLNSVVGGVSNSQHRLGEAVDFICPAYGTPGQICTALLNAADLLDFDQLIHEPSWVHISFLASPLNLRTTPRNQYIDLSKGGK